MPEWNSTIRFLIVEAICLIASLLVVVLIGIGSGLLAVHSYDINHAIPDPVLRGDDLGGPIVGMVAMLNSLFISVPLALCIHIYILWKYFFKKGTSKFSFFGRERHLVRQSHVG